MTFGRYLRRHAIVSEEQLKDATTALVLFGGRLGTHLVERGALTPDELERHLAAHLDVVAAPPERLEKPCDAALAALPRALIQRHKLFPFDLEAGRLEVAMRDPRDRALCAVLSRASGLRIAPFLIAEIRLFFLLEKHFGIERNQRYALLASRDAAKPEPPAVLWLDDVVEAEEKEDERGWTPLAKGEELIDAASFAAIYQQAEGPHGRRTTAPLEPRTGEGRPEPKGWLVAGATSAAALEAGLEQARDRDAVVSHALALALGHARAVALFAVRGTAQGIAAAGEIERRDLRDVLVASEPGSLLAAAIERGAPARGTPEPEGVDARVARLLRRMEPAEVAYFPIRIGDRVVNLLYADNGCEPLGETSCSALAALCQRVTQSYERIIHEMKQRLC
jgi:hypothetical protein